MIKLPIFITLRLTTSSNLFIQNVETKDYEINNATMYDDGMYYATMPDENAIYCPFENSVYNTLSP